MYTNLGCAKDGSVIYIYGSQCYWLKCCDKHTGIGGAVNLLTGQYVPGYDFEKYGLHIEKVRQVAEDLDALYFDEDEEEDADACERESLGNNWW